MKKVYHVAGPYNGKFYIEDEAGEILRGGEILYGDKQKYCYSCTADAEKVVRELNGEKEKPTTKTAADNSKQEAKEKTTGKAPAPENIGITQKKKKYRVIEMRTNNDIYIIDEESKRWSPDGEGVEYFGTRKEADEMCEELNREVEIRTTKMPIPNNITGDHADKWYNDNDAYIRRRAEEAINKQYHRERGDKSFDKRITFFRGLPMVVAIVAAILLTIPSIIIGVIVGEFAGYKTPDGDLNKYAVVFPLMLWAVCGIIAAVPFLGAQKTKQKEYKKLGTMENGVMTYTQEEVDALIKEAVRKYESDAVRDNEYFRNRNDEVLKENSDVVDMYNALCQKHKNTLLTVFELSKEYPTLAKKLGLDKLTPTEAAAATGMSTKEAFDKFFKDKK